MSIPATTSQTVGPYYRIGLSYRFSSATFVGKIPGEYITLRGALFDGTGAPIPDAQLEIWQADDEGRFAGLDTGTGLPVPGFKGFARVPFDDDGRYVFHTIKPGAVASSDRVHQAPHLLVLLFMRGLLKHLYTRIYFAGNPHNENDPVLLAVPEERRITLLAQPVEDKLGEFQWNIHLQGDMETVFFEF